ncbi:14354_t:CDS:1, partial [Acaulospora colombiana]
MGLTKTHKDHTTDVNFESAMRTSTCIYKTSEYAANAVVIVPEMNSSALLAKSDNAAR